MLFDLLTYLFRLNFFIDQNFMKNLILFLVLALYKLNHNIYYRVNDNIIINIFFMRGVLESSWLLTTYYYLVFILIFSNLTPFYMRPIIN